jgi:hypothetical protein
MTYDEVVNTLLLRFGGIQKLKAGVEAELKYVKEMVLEKDSQLNPWFLLPTATADLVATANAKSVTLPGDFKAEYEFGFAYYPSTDDANFPFLEMSKENYDVLEAREGEGTATIPTRYAVVGTQFYPYPIPSANVTLKIMYYQTQPDLRSGSSNLWLTHAADWLMAETGLRIAMFHTHDTEKAQLFEADRQKARHRVQAETLERQLANIDFDLS